MSDKQNLNRGMLWNAVGNLIYLGCQWLVTIFVTNLGADFTDAGILSIAMSVSATFQTIALFGIRNFQVSDINGKYTDTAYVAFRIITCAVALLGCIVFSLISGYLGATLLSIIFFMFFRLAENFSDVLHGILQKNNRLDLVGKAFAIKGIALIASFLAAYTLSGSLSLGILAMALVSIATTVAYDLLNTRKLSRFRAYDSLKNCIALSKETLPLCVYLFLSAAIVTIPKLILEKELGGEILGAYASIFAPAILIQAAMGYIYNPFAQIFADYKERREVRAFSLLGVKIAGAIAVLTALMLLASSLFGEFALKLLFSEDILPYVHLLSPILIAITVTSVFGFLCMIATVLRSIAALVISSFVGFLLCIFLTAPMIKLYSANGASISLIIATAASSLILLVVIAFKLIKIGKSHPNSTENS